MNDFNKDGWYNLAVAVITATIQEYQAGNIWQRRAIERELRECDWILALAGIEPDELISAIKRRASEYEVKLKEKENLKNGKESIETEQA